jgi:hypothetical protein
MNRGQKLQLLNEGLQKDFLLSDNEAEAILGFKGGECTKLNFSIRTETLTEEQKIMSASLDSGLAKLPTVSSEVLYRNLQLFDEQIERAADFFKSNVGKTVIFKDFLSCTRRSNFTGNETDFSWVMEIQTLENSQARDIEAIWKEFDLSDTERKVAFTKNSCFRVVDCDPNSYIKVKLTETEESGIPIVVPYF